MKWPGLETYNQDSPEDVRERALRENFARLGATISRAGVNILAQAKTSQEYASLSGSATNFEPFALGFQSSGGLVLVYAALSVNVANAAYSARLLVDGQGQLSKVCASTSTENQTVTLLYAGNLAPGNHTVNLSHYVTPAGSAGINNSSVWGSPHQSEIYVFEFIF